MCTSLQAFCQIRHCFLQDRQTRDLLCHLVLPSHVLGRQLPFRLAPTLLPPDLSTSGLTQRLIQPEAGSLPAFPFRVAIVSGSVSCYREYCLQIALICIFCLAINRPYRVVYSFYIVSIIRWQAHHLLTPKKAIL